MPFLRSRKAVNIRPPFFFQNTSQNRTLNDGPKSASGVKEPPFVTFLGWMMALGPVVLAGYCFYYPLDRELDRTLQLSRSPDARRELEELAPR